MPESNLVLWVTHPEVRHRSARPEVDSQGRNVRSVAASELSPLDAQAARAIVWECDEPTPDSRTRLLRIQSMAPHRPVIVVAHTLTIPFLLWALRAGIADVLRTPLSLHELDQAILRPSDRTDRRRRAVHTAAVRDGTDPPVLGARDSGLSQVLGFVDNNVDELIRESAMAALCGKSASQFCRDFKAAVGSTFLAYLTDVRMAKARTLLADASVPVADVAVACGYADPSYFSRAFRRRVGETPSSYRAQATQRIAPTKPTCPERPPGKRPRQPFRPVTSAPLRSVTPGAGARTQP